MRKISAKKLKEWFDCAEKIFRSTRHLAKIQRIIDQKYNNGIGYIELSLRDYRAMLKDYEDYRAMLKNSKEVESTSNLIKLKSDTYNKENQSKYTVLSELKKSDTRELTHSETEALYGLISRGTPYSPRL